MDELVKPQWEVTDYRTFVSGITKEMLDAAKVDFATCQKQVLALLHGKILVGHGLKSDLSVLGITHPWYMIRDTAKYEPYMKIRYQDGGLWPRALKDLCKEMLNRDIQVQGRAHCPKEDAMAALDLYKCVLEPWENSMEYHWNRSITMQRHRMARQQRAVVAM
ncbi:Interferon-stimulated 20 kDa exonuclease-like 2 [Seminavis robusta]|nr:Interferon-stimulated 20 kDa exonuclease-like 2 [Seminavis robusta]|eukprot:Sro250_g099110.1 Interferon-stimulated 20 kDa exonuclease-like 2 (163) ;mRNA; r:83211-83699